jgi:serine/threonine protein kinase
MFVESEDLLEEWLTHLQNISIFTDIEADYKFKEKIGDGSFSVVHRARSLINGGNFAVK